MEERLEAAISWGIKLLVSLMPFHAFLAIYLGKLLGGQAIFQAWKEALVLLMTAAAAILWWRRRSLRIQSINLTNYLVLAYAAVALLVSVISRPPLLALLFGIKTNLVFLIVFLIAQVAATKTLVNKLAKILIVTTALVTGFGLLQIFFLPIDFLSRFGYGPDTVLPFAKVDPAISAVRIISTLGGPNQLGSFLILPLCLLVALLIRRFRWWQLPLLGATLLTLIHTYSRSAWLGAAIAVFVTLFAVLPKKVSWATAASLVVLGLAAILLFNRSITSDSRLQYYLLHSRALTYDATSSDFQRLEAIKQGLQIVQDRPLGGGLGTAGPASRYGQAEIISENYYLQIAIETGVIGLSLFLALTVGLGIALFQQARRSILAAALASSLVGISVINLFLHGWTDSSTALVWWACAGTVVGAIYKTRANSVQANPV